MKRAFLPLFLLGAFALLPSVFAADPPSNGGGREGTNSRIAYRRLTWNDFRIDDATPGMSAQSHTYTSFGFKTRVQGRGGSYVATVAELTFDGGFDRQRSWRRSYVNERSELLLNHEQGHFDLAEIKLRQLRRWKLDEMPQGTGRTPEEAYKDLKKRLETLYHDEIKDLEETQRRYDRETDHGTRREIQAQWRQRLDRALEQLPPVSTRLSKPPQSAQIRV